MFVIGYSWVFCISDFPVTVILDFKLKRKIDTHAKMLSHKKELVKDCFPELPISIMLITKYYFLHTGFR